MPRKMTKSQVTKAIIAAANRYAAEVHPIVERALDLKMPLGSLMGIAYEVASNFAPKTKVKKASKAKA